VSPFKEPSAINFAETKPNNDKKPPVSEAEALPEEKIFRFVVNCAKI